MLNAVRSQDAPASGPRRVEARLGLRRLYGRRQVLCLSLALLTSCAFGSFHAKSQDIERIPVGEGQAINTIVSRAVAELRKRYPPGAELMRRDAHAKGHGCVKATFRVDENLPAELQVGTFSPGKKYRAWVRFSNGAFEPGADTGMDGRGMALKIMDLSSAGDAASPGAVHDILMINYPVFFSPDAVDYAEFAAAGALTGDPDGLKRYFFPSYNPFRWRLRQGLIAYRIASQKITSPLSTQYFSMVPYLFGPGRAVKYSARECTPTDGPRGTDLSAPDFLKNTMQEQLRHGPACFELMVQERRNGMSIEDATAEWSEDESPFRRVGLITIPQQQFDTAERMAFCENAAFNPWNAPPEHRPLGSINRVRKAVYEKISAERHSRNGVPVADPVSAWDRF